MFSKLIPLALCALSFVQAFPFSYNQNTISCAISVNYEVAPQGDLSVQDLPGPHPVEAPQFGHQGYRKHGNDGMWIAVQSGSKYKIGNVGCNAFVSIGEGNRLFVCQGATPAEFSLLYNGADTYTNSAK
ncbi:hypothetical protein B0H14DRAFT_3426833 [Mycena olivaceomarginata]|nr:hypothetical protein B0H14DRAFT_3426833 [Mycena olivaceomarginata]